MPPDYVEQLQLHIPENLITLLTDVVLSFLDKSGFKRMEAKRIATIVEKAGQKEYSGMFEAAIESIKEGQQRALEKGREEEKLRTAANFKKLGVSIEIIAQATGLTIEEIEGM